MLLREIKKKENELSLRVKDDYDTNEAMQLECILRADELAIKPVTIAVSMGTVKIGDKDMPITETVTFLGIGNKAHINELNSEDFKTRIEYKYNENIEVSNIFNSLANVESLKNFKFTQLTNGLEKLVNSNSDVFITSNLLSSFICSNILFIYPAHGVGILAKEEVKSSKGEYVIKTGIFSKITNRHTISGRKSNFKHNLNNYLKTITSVKVVNTDNKSIFISGYKLLMN